MGTSPGMASAIGLSWGVFFSFLSLCLSLSLTPLFAAKRGFTFFTLRELVTVRWRNVAEKCEPRAD